MNFKTRALSLLVAVAATVAPVLAHPSGHTSGPHGSGPNPTTPPKNLNPKGRLFPAYAVACDTAEDFFDDGGFSKFTSTHGHISWTGGLDSDNGDGTGIRTDANTAPAGNFQMNVVEFSDFSDPYISFYYRTQFGFNSDFFFLNDSLPDFITTASNSDGSTTYFFDAPTYFGGSTAGITWASIYLMDYGSDDGDPEAFSDAVNFVKVNNQNATPQIHGVQGVPQSDCNG